MKRPILITNCIGDFNIYLTDKTPSVIKRIITDFVDGITETMEELEKDLVITSEDIGIFEIFGEDSEIYRFNY